jgi:predicted AlkP superfamily pyrophosphatase or phosphodiesterase
VTYANAVSMLTGCWPSTHGAWSNAAFDRDQLRTVDYESHRERATDDVSCDSMFELLGGELTAGVALPFERGVKISRVQSADTGGIEFGFDWITGQKQAADESLAEQLQDIGVTASRVGEWPAFIAVYVPAADEIGHMQGSDTPEYRDAVANLDDAIGGLLEAFERGGMLDDLTIVLTSDHGHHPTPWSIDPQAYLSAALQMPVVVGPADDEDEATFVERWERYAPARVVAIRNGGREASRTCARASAGTAAHLRADHGLPGSGARPPARPLRRPPSR